MSDRAPLARAVARGQACAGPQMRLAFSGGVR